MQLSSRILTALAVLILAVAVVAVRAGSTDTVEAATGTIDVLNVGTCFATDDVIFEASDCNDGDMVDNDDNSDNDNGYNVAGRTSVGEVPMVYATYAHDPKTAPDDPRAILTNSNLIKVSISDSGRNKPIPVLLPVSGAPNANQDPCPQTGCVFDRPSSDDDKGGYLQIIRETYPGIEIPLTVRGTEANTTLMRWQPRVGDVTAGEGHQLDGPGVETGIYINRIQGNQSPISPDDAVDYMPMDISDDSLITFWGRIYDSTDNTGNASSLVNLKDHIKLDEDKGSGGTGTLGEEEQEVAPWLSIQKSITAGTSIELMYIVYHTSEFETLIGGNTQANYEGASAFAPDFSKSEVQNNNALVVEARSDGRDGTRNLYLRETSRFSGRYEGYVRLTDENGGGDENGWGLTPKHAEGHGLGPDEAATIGVESGPLVIAYRDTDGTLQQKEIEIDTVPPSINIDTPAHKSEGQDISPEFSGSFADTDSGLREDTFHLYVDHEEDVNESGDNSIDPILALDLRGPAAGVAGTGGDPVESQEDYIGYGDDTEFAVIGHQVVFRSQERTDPPFKVVEPDNYGDHDRTGTFGGSVRIEFLDDDYNHTIDFQAVVADIAGNLGFSDSDPEGPNFINDLGEDKPKTGRYNVIGWYARHIFFLDEVPPAIFKEQSVTGFYGVNDDDEPQVSRSGILVAFDKAVDADSIGVETFSVTLDKDGTQPVDIVDVDVQGRSVYLLLESELASDARPYVDIPSGEWVSDPAGNRLTGGAQSPFETKDGISPVLTVTLSNGSGTGEGNEGPSALTNNAITATISADEEISSTPSLVVVCSNIAWDSDGDGENDKAVADIGNQRSGSLDIGTASFMSGEGDDPNLYGRDFYCGDDADERTMQQLQSYSRPGLNWEYQWVNLTGDRKLPNGKLTVVAFARDRQTFTSLEETRRYNWGSAHVEFRFDTELPEPGTTPEDGATVTESRPFVLLTYDDATTVSVDEFSIDGTVAEISSIGNNRFLYWPEALGLGTHEVSVMATDAAGNEESFNYSFKVAERKDFNMKLIAGWNAVSFPANPMDNAIGSVFTEDVIDMVAGWDGSDPEKPWSIATRMEGEWSTHEEFATLNKVHAQYGYWVHAQGFVTQRVKLIGGINRADPDVTPPDLVSIPTLPGWNFVGVIDQDGDQTEAHWGETLMNGDTSINAGSYLGSNKRAYKWDAVRNEFQILENGDEVSIGDGIWVYYGGGIAP